MKHQKRVAAGTVAMLAASGGAVLASSAWTAEGAAGSPGWPRVSSEQPAALEEAARSRGGTTMVLREVVLRAEEVDVGASGESPGDYFIFESRLETRAGEAVGRDSVRCMLMIRTFTCDGTAQLFGKGKLTVYGTLFGVNDATIAITGGTGDFRKARGQVTVGGADGDLLFFHITG
jgi:hypothetical protein